MKKLLTIVFCILLFTACGLFQPEATPTARPTKTEPPVPPTETFTPILPTETSVSPTGTLLPPTETATPIPPTATTNQVTQAEGTYTMEALCRQSVDAMLDLHAGLTAPSYFEMTESDLEHVVSSFDVNRYFDVLEHVGVEDGYYMSHMYFYDDLGGKPVLYTAPVGDGPFLLYEDYVEYLGEEMQWESSYSSLYHAYDYLAHITIDDTPDGFFQYLVMVMLGDQFRLSWHALYNDTIIICDQSDIDWVNTELADWEVELPADAAAQVPQMDLTPYVVFEEDTVTIRFIQFTKWGGYAESIYVLDRAAPYMLLDVQWDELIPYDCGIAF